MPDYANSAKTQADPSGFVMTEKDKQKLRDKEMLQGAMGAAWLFILGCLFFVVKIIPPLYRWLLQHKNIREGYNPPQVSDTNRRVLVICKKLLNICFFHVIWVWKKFNNSVR